MAVGDADPSTRGETHTGGAGFLATLSGARPRATTGLAVAVASVAAATVAITPLSDVAPVVSLSVVYLVPVLLVSTYWGLPLGLATSLLSAAAFNWFHLPPAGRFTIADSRNWVALGAFTVVAVVASTIAEIARSRTREAQQGQAEADLAAALARELLVGQDTRQALAGAARRIAEALGLRSAAIELGLAEAGVRRRALPLRTADGTQIATLLVPDDLADQTGEALERRVAPALGALVAIALRRDELQAEAVQTAALRRSDDVKTALLRTVSHDLRTPLTAVVAAGHALGASSLTDAERDELSRAVVQEGTRLATLVEKLLDLSRLQGGGAQPRPDWVSVEDLVNGAVESLGERPPDVRVVVDADMPEVRVDAPQLERALANLLENADRYSGGRPVSVRVRRAAGRVLVSVVDQGPGIPASELDRVFEAFYRGRTASPQPSTGSGLGLAIAKGFVEAQGGTLRVQSLPGQGTSFVISLPIAERAAGRMSTTALPDSAPSR
jgi:two-component system sensor histidine kinase KdpD